MRKGQKIKVPTKKNVRYWKSLVGKVGKNKGKHWKIKDTSKMKGRLGDKNGTWKGEKAGYHAIHLWVNKYYGSPSVCDHCFTKTAKKYEWANKNHTYKRLREDWLRLCTSCHRLFDIQNNGYIVNNNFKQ